MIIVDDQSGTFLFTRDRSGNSGTLVIQLWSPIDYWTAGWDTLEPPNPDWDFKVVLAAWSIDDKGEEREINLDPWDYDRETEAKREVIGEGRGLDGISGGAQLTLLDGFPDGTPDPVRRAMRDYEKRRVAAWQQMADTLNNAHRRNVWLRLFGGDAVGGKVKSLSEQYVSLEKPRNLEYESAKASGHHEVNRIAAARIFPGRRMPKRVFGPTFGDWMKETDVATTRPQLWDALCPNCIRAVKPPWRSGMCRECRAGNLRDEYSGVPDEQLERLLEARAEWQDFEVMIESTGGRWVVAFKRPNGEIVAGTIEPMSVENADRREALIELLRLAEAEGFTLTPDSWGFRKHPTDEINPTGTGIEETLESLEKKYGGPEKD